MSTDEPSFIDTLSIARTGNLVSEFEYLRVFDAELDDPATEATVYTLAPEVDDSDVSEAFRRAAVQWGNASSHPNVVTVFDHGTDPLPWIAVEKMEGERLKSVQGSLSREDVRTVIEDTAEALRNAALYNTNHMALSPGCIWIVRRDGQRRAVVDDWGLHLAVRRAAGELPSNEYLAPEILAGESGDKRADVYGLGLVSYYALTGRSPPSREGGDVPDGSDVELTPPSTVDESLSTSVDDVILRSISINPDNRQQSSFEFKQEILRAIPDRSSVNSQSDTSESENAEPDEEVDRGDEKRQQDLSGTAGNSYDNQSSGISLEAIVALAGAGILLLFIVGSYGACVFAGAELPLVGSPPGVSCGVDASIEDPEAELTEESLTVSGVLMENGQRYGENTTNIDVSIYTNDSLAEAVTEEVDLMNGSFDREVDVNRSNWSSSEVANVTLEWNGGASQSVDPHATDESATPTEENNQTATTAEPTENPTQDPNETPTEGPTNMTTEDPTETPTDEPANTTTEDPTDTPTEAISTAIENTSSLSAGTAFDTRAPGLKIPLSAPGLSP